MTRRRPTRAAAAVVWAGLAAILAGQQPAAPEITRQQRAALQAILTAIDRAAAEPDTAGVDWTMHMLRASNGAHYVAFSVHDPPAMAAGQPVTLYVRLATRRDERPGAAIERSALAEWLAGSTAGPPPGQRGLALGDMPVFGAGSAAAAGRDPSASTRGPAPQSLALLEMQRERARERREAEERERKAQLEGKGSRPSTLLPFEDFDLRAAPEGASGGAPSLRRSLIAGPGAYELYVAWVDPAAKNLSAAVTVLKRTIQLPVASSTEFALSSAIVADEVSVSESPVPPSQQTAHPYSIASTVITPARDHVLTNDERLALVVQVINPRPAADGRPDVSVGFRISRITAKGQETVGTLKPQAYNASTLPPDFDARQSHPLFAAVSVPLASFRRGRYRVEIVAEDRLAGVNAMTDAAFDVVATPAALLRDAPPLAPPFRREAILEASILNAMVDALRPARPSTAMSAAIDAARARRFIDIVRADEVAPPEQEVRTALRALALYALGDSPTTVGALLRPSAQTSASARAAVQGLAGALSALAGNDREAVAAWQAAVASGLGVPALALLAAEAELRLGDPDRAAEHAAQARRPPVEAAAQRLLAAAHIAAGREADAVPLLESVLRDHADDADAQWLLLHALFSGFVKGQGPGAMPERRAEMKALAARYAAADGRHRTLAGEWAEAVR